MITFDCCFSFYINLRNNIFICANLTLNHLANVYYDVIQDLSEISGIEKPSIMTASGYFDVVRNKIALGETNIDLQPGFADAENGDFNLTPSSPCINAGQPGFLFNDGDGS